ncbi:MAG: hypothetical protein C4536_11750 [Actinobacteria bacterium]|jgi:hypothetical protein|nr:MAG: hypothetical protein C4536_11750 [Actinomycetota bacterium]
MARRSILAALVAMIVFLSLCCSVYAQEEQPVPPVEEEEAPASGHIFLYKDGELVEVQRDLTGGNQMVEFAVLELLKGPSEEEAAAGYVTYIPEGVKLQYTTVKQDRSEFGVNLSRELMDLSGDTDGSLKALTQIVKTIQDASDIQTVGITVAGEAMGDPPQDAFEALGVSASEVEGGKQETEPAQESSNTGLVLGIVFGALGAVILAFLAFYFFKRRKPAEPKASGKKAAAKKPSGKKAKK